MVDSVNNNNNNVQSPSSCNWSTTPSNLEAASASLSPAVSTTNNAVNGKTPAGSSSAPSSVQSKKQGTALSTTALNALNLQQQLLQQQVAGSATKQQQGDWGRKSLSNIAQRI